MAVAPPESGGVPKVLFVDYSVGFGGATKSLSLLLDELKNASPILITSQLPQIRSWYPAVTRYTFRPFAHYRAIEHARWVVNHKWPPGVKWVALKLLAALDLGVGVKNLPRFLWIMKRHQIELVHLNNGFGPFEAVAAAGLLGIPCVVHLRGIPEPESGLGQWMARQVKGIIAISQAVADALPAGSPPTWVIHNSVDPRRFEVGAETRSRVRQEWGVGENEVAVGIVGRVVDWKGHLEFVRAMIEALKTNPQLRGIVLGDQSDEEIEYYHRVRGLVDESHVRDRFLFPGHRESVEPYYAGLDIVVHASLTPEPFGRTIIEGMAARRAVIASAAGGPAEVITPGVDGLLVPPGDVAALTRAIVDLAGNPDRRRALGAAGYDTVRRRFTPDVAAAKVRGVYREVQRSANR